jgi:DNA-binding winged helix-turn-helix (wHTH) protein
MAKMSQIRGDVPSSDKDIVLFGPFRLWVTRRTLHRGDDEIPLGGRAFDLLVALVEHAGEILTPRRLIERVWPEIFVEEANLRVHIASLRKVLGDGRDGVRYIENVTRRGYCFVAPVDRVSLGRSDPRQAASAPGPGFRSNLPPPLGRMVGREGAVSALAELLAARRFVTIVGAGGMGKTTVALSVAHAVLDDFGGTVAFVDLGAVAKGDLVDVTVASALGFAPQAEIARPGLLALLREKHLLIVLDNCEHVIDTVASLAERLFSEAPQVFILATSREALRVEGEHVYLLTPLDNPPPDLSLTAGQALTWPAI